MSQDYFRILITSHSGCGKTNTLINILWETLIYYDKIDLYARYLEQYGY